MHTIEEAVQALASGLPILVADDEDRENEGDLICAAEFATPDMVNLFASEGRGLVCSVLSPDRAKILGLELIRSVHGPAPLHGTAFTVGVDYVHGTTTGISTADRSATLRALADSASRAEDFARPGHIFPLIAKEGGVLERRGHTEATLDLCRLAGLSGAGVLCEVLNPDGTMAHYADLEALSRRLGIPFVTVEALVEYKARTQNPLRILETVDLPTRHGLFELTLFGGPGNSRPLGLRRAGPLGPGAAAPLVRVHSECLTADVFGSLLSDQAQLEESLRLIAAEPRGAVVYLQQEGRGLGLEATLRAFVHQQDGLDTVDANLVQGLPADLRTYNEAAWILRSWGWTSIRLLTNNPDKVSGLEKAGVSVVEILPLGVGSHPANLNYRRTKRDRMGHSYFPVSGEQT